MTYAEAQFPRGGVVAGYRLRPLTLGHALLLSRLRSPFMPDGEKRQPEAGDVALAIWILSRPWRRAFRSLHARCSRWIRAAMAGGLILQLPQAIRDLDDYLVNQMTGPKRKSGAGPSLRSPALAVLKVTAMTDLGLTEWEALDRPLALTIWDAAVAAERRGDADLEAAGPVYEDFRWLVDAAQEIWAQEKAGVPHG